MYIVVHQDGEYSESSDNAVAALASQAPPSWSPQIKPAMARLSHVAVPARDAVTVDILAHYVAKSPENAGVRPKIDSIYFVDKATPKNML